MTKAWVYVYNVYGDSMLYSYKELINQGLKRYQIESNTKNKKLFKVSKGIYSDSEKPSDLAIVMKKYPNSILTLQSAFYLHNLTSKKPDIYFLATDKKSHIIEDPSVNQIFTTRKFLNVGLTTLKVDDSVVNIYDKERLFIELIRYRTKLPYTLYKEILDNYRKIRDDINFINLFKYSKLFDKSYITNAIITEMM